MDQTYKEIMDDLIRNPTAHRRPWESLWWARGQYSLLHYLLESPSPSPLQRKPVPPEGVWAHCPALSPMSLHCYVRWVLRLWGSCRWPLRSPWYPGHQILGVSAGVLAREASLASVAVASISTRKEEDENCTFKLCKNILYIYIEMIFTW